MKKALSLFLSIVLVLGVFLSIPFTGSPFKITAEAASSGTCGDNLTWTLDNSGVLTISGTGAMTNYSFSSSAPWYSSRSSIKEVVINKGVTSIGDSAFRSCTSLTSITIPDSVTSIGDEAFSNCTSLTSITIPDSVTSIGNRAFYDCDSLTSVTIGNSVTSIGQSAFYNTAYYNDSSNWENGVLYIGNHLIEANESISGSYEIKAGTKTIADYAFCECDSLTSITIPDSVTSIGVRAFFYCTSLTSITIPDSVTSIGDYAFLVCNSLTAINVSSSNQYYTSVNGVLFNKAKTQLIQYPASKTNASYAIPDSVTSIGEDAFEDCYSLTSITIPGSVTRIGNDAFYKCTSLSDVYYSGSSEDWSKISIGSYNYPLLNATIHCTCSHTSTKWITDKAATCTVAGSRHKECTVCGETLETQTISATGHTESKWITDKAATCTVAGSKHKVCTVCGKTLETQTISATGHTESSWITDKAATVNAAGSKYKRCTVCGNTLETAVIPQLTCATPTLSSAMNANGGVTVTWKAVSGADSYRVYRKTASSGWSGIKSNVKTTSYTDTTAKSGTTYYYTVRAENEAGLSGYNSTGVSVKYLAMPTVTLSNTTTGIKVSWSKIAGATGYYVYRKESGEWTQCATISDGSKVSYTDTKAKTGSTYSYSVMAYDSTTTSDYNSKGVSVKCLATPTVTVANAATGVKVSWNKISGASKYYVYRKASSEKDWTLLTNSATGTSYTDTKAKSGTTYYYMVKAVSGSSVSSYISSSALRYLAQPKVSSLSNTNSGITVKWNKITGAKGYTVYRKASGATSWTNIGDTTGTSFTDKKAKAGTTYYYTVRAYNGSAKSTYTSSTAIRRLTTPTLKSVSSAKSGITFKWNKVTGASGYYVYRKTGSGSWQKIATVKSGSTVSYLDKTAKKGTTYTYTVKAYYGSNVSAYNTTGLKIKDKY